MLGEVIGVKARLVIGFDQPQAASIDLAYVAAGRYECFWEEGLSSWDMAAGIILVREAGGYVSDMKGGQTMFQSSSILASNGTLHAPLQALLGSR